MLTCRSKAQKQRYDSYARFKRTPTATLFQQLMDDAMANDALWLARNGN
jgi:hypothetical protein